jgi:hypothetical protein
MQEGSSSYSNSSNCSIELISAGAARLVVVKALVDELGLGINDAKTLVDSTPCVLADGLSLSRAKELAQLLSKTGSKIAVNQNGKTIFVEEPSIEEESQTEEQNWGNICNTQGMHLSLCVYYTFLECLTMTVQVTKVKRYKQKRGKNHHLRNKLMRQNKKYHVLFLKMGTDIQPRTELTDNKDMEYLVTIIIQLKSTKMVQQK